MHMRGHEFWVPWARPGLALSKCPVPATGLPGPPQAAHVGEQQSGKCPKQSKPPMPFKQTTKPTGLISHTEGQETQFVLNTV